MTDRSSLAHDLATQLAPVGRAWRQLADRILASLEISNSAGWALVHLERLGAGARQADLARAIGITEASLTTTVRQLESAGLVERLADAGDRRANLLHLTREGAGIARKAEARLVALRGELLDGIPDADLEAAVNLITTVGNRAAEMRGRT
ncbi:MarR family transcriptional regulator [Novosphingobium resinovorum]|uniref:MarR family transcriptional regulator n=1 Tax=Novosphingobium resinovorum TaxID=158500 RepID=A0A031K3H1_9SPHN|nr:MULTISPECIES: MarR family transcriptional regulator [Sphingomonadaceae]AOR75556.1 MarR family transcriptional regulator [Novosphingobium resinovorum]EJU09957.1 MarR family transcriptional regulator [Sphingomonas sp. LH128]EZP84506.1 MarR family transcriptional regulator [Novosphingobium resinovorum]MBF7010878.1 MarR family transcriptional regulator [Novosphingobium sp. HR1a]WJM28875.1 MarR family transcriptional regulator [Novosphingobium resinovorum]